jgi:hypothetical protein
MKTMEHPTTLSIKGIGNWLHVDRAGDVLLTDAVASVRPDVRRS